MKKEKLIQELQKLPDGVEICVFDVRKNIDHDLGDGSSEGIYPHYEISMMDEEGVQEGTEPFAVLTIENDDYPDYGGGEND